MASNNMLSGNAECRTILRKTEAAPVSWEGARTHI